MSTTKITFLSRTSQVIDHLPQGTIKCGRLRAMPCDEIHYSTISDEWVTRTNGKRSYSPLEDASNVRSGLLNLIVYPPASSELLVND